MKGTRDAVRKGAVKFELKSNSNAAMSIIKWKLFPKIKMSKEMKEC